VLGSNSRRLLDPEHREKYEGRLLHAREYVYEGVNSVMSRAINVLDFSSEESPGGLFIGAVRGSGNNVHMTPITIPFTLSVQSQGYHNHFTPLTTLHVAYYMATCVPSGQASVRYAAQVFGPSRHPLPSSGHLLNDGLHLCENLRPPLWILYSSSCQKS
jgi:hypothetical protein